MVKRRGPGGSTNVKQKFEQYSVSSVKNKHETVMRLLNYAVAWLALSVVYVYNYFFTFGYVHVQIDKGIIRGRNASTWQGRSYFSFKGIPYAKPPLGQLRFKAPQEEKEWTGVRDAINHGAVCPHMDIGFQVFRGSEDCLFLNVYTPSLGSRNLPVIVWIHGGMFTQASGNDEVFGPDYLVEAGVILVTFNYRLGALGFLTTEDDGAPGNAGMKDQVAALRWIRRNIAKFGGDPENVTIFGASTGAACVEYHLLSPMSTGLFARGIAHSGSALNTWALSVNGTASAIRLAEGLGARNLAGNKARALEFLKSVPPREIVRVQGSLITPAEERLRIEFLFSPSIERGVTSEEIFLPDSPLNIWKSGSYNKVPYITGYTSHEGHLFLHELVKPKMMKAAFEDTERLVPIDIRNQQRRNSLAKLIRKFYFNDKPIGSRNISNLVDLYGDVSFVAAVKRATKLHLASTNSPIYFYVFSYDGGMNLIKGTFGINRPGAVHGDELGYLFHSKLLFWKTPVRGSDDEHIVHTMIRLWTNFAKFGDPTPAGDPLTWKPLTIDKFNYLHISGRDTKLEKDPDPERTDFWAKAYEEDT